MFCARSVPVVNILWLQVGADAVKNEENALNIDDPNSKQMQHAGVAFIQMYIPLKFEISSPS